ncbi:MAG: hypothetical protein AAFN50_12200, partial [Pseudomonadota bacterium]
MVRESTETPNTDSRLSDDRDRLTLVSQYSPAGDQGQAIDGLIGGLEDGLARQVLLGVTGSGKTYTITQTATSASASCRQRRPCRQRRNRPMAGVRS